MCVWVANNYIRGERGGEGRVVTVPGVCPSGNKPFSFATLHSIAQPCIMLKNPETLEAKFYVLNRKTCRKPGNSYIKYPLNYM